MTPANTNNTKPVLRKYPTYCRNCGVHYRNHQFRVVGGLITAENGCIANVWMDFFYKLTFEGHQFAKGGP